MSAEGEEILSVLGRQMTDPVLEDLFHRLDIVWRPEVGPDRRNDWIATANVEFGFEDFGYFTGQDAMPRGQAAVLQQVCFYAARPGESHDPLIGLPGNLDFAHDRQEVRRRLTRQASSIRLGRRDAFEIGGATFSVAYNDATSNIDVLLVLMERASRKSLAVPPLNSSELLSYLGLRWYDRALRRRFYSLTEAEGAVGQVKKHGTCNLIREAAVRLLYDRSNPTWTLSGFEVYRHRVLDSADWLGNLPHGLTFYDSPAQMSQKLCVEPSFWHEGDLEAFGSWSVSELDIAVTFDMIINLVSSVRYERRGTGT
jgi:hypothetical protein